LTENKFGIDRLGVVFRVAGFGLDLFEHGMARKNAYVGAAARQAAHGKTILISARS